MDGCRTLCLLSMVLSACGSDTSADTGGLSGFYVASSSPEQGATDVLANQAPEFFLSGPADPAACNESQFILAAIDESGEYAFDVDFGVSVSEDGLSVSLTHKEAFLNGFWYVAMVRDTESPCVDSDGEAIRPFGVEFYVP